MLRRAFVALGASLLIPAIFKSVKVPELGAIPMEDLSRLKIYGLTVDGRRIDHSIEWYGEFYNGRTRTIRICHSQVVPKNAFIKKLIFEIDGTVVHQFGQAKNDLPLNPGKQTNWSQFGTPFNGFKPPTAIRVNQIYTDFYKEATDNIAWFGTPA